MGMKHLIAVIGDSEVKPTDHSAQGQLLVWALEPP